MRSSRQQEVTQTNAAGNTLNCSHELSMYSTRREPSSGAPGAKSMSGGIAGERAGMGGGREKERISKEPDSAPVSAIILAGQCTSLSHFCHRCVVLSLHYETSYVSVS